MSSGNTPKRPDQSLCQEMIPGQWTTRYLETKGYIEAEWLRQALSAYSWSPSIPGTSLSNQTTTWKSTTPERDEVSDEIKVGDIRISLSGDEIEVLAVTGLHFWGQWDNEITPHTHTLNWGRNY